MFPDAEEQADGKEILSREFATAGWIAVGQTVNQASEFGVRAPQRFCFELLDDAAFLDLKIIAGVSTDVLGHVLWHSANAVTSLLQDMHE
jgi:hypothetical protein